jgi:hypothetical protein
MHDISSINPEIILCENAKRIQDHFIGIDTCSSTVFADLAYWSTGIQQQPANRV